MVRPFISSAYILTGALLLGAQSGPHYDRARETTYAGTITAVVAFPAADGSVGVHLDLKTGGGKIVSVHVGPAAYIGEQNFWFFADDQVEIVGAPTIIDDNVSIWAKAVQKGSNTLVLRTADGTTKWTPESDGIDGCGVNHLSLARATER
jgi:hypothetical protein